MLFFITLWILSPFALIPLFIIYFNLNNKNKKQLKKYKNELIRLMNENKISKQDFDIIMLHINSSNTTSQHYNEPQIQNTPPFPQNNTQANFNSQPQQPIQNTFPTPPVTPPPIMERQAPLQQPYINPTPVINTTNINNYANKPMDDSTKTSVVLILGVALVVLAGLIFATTTWHSLSSFSKIIIIFSVTAIFFGVSVFAEKKFNLRKTSTAFYILGSFFLPLTIISAGYFELLGEWLSLYGDGNFTLWTIAFVALGASSYIGSKKYKFSFFAWVFLISTTTSFLCLLNQFKLPNDIFAICLAVYATVLLFVSDLCEVPEDDKSSITAILKIFVIINISVLSAISIYITSDGIISFIPLVIFALAFLKSTFIYSEKSIGVFPYTIFMLLGFCKLFTPESTSEFLLPVTAVAVISTILGVAKVYKNPVNKLLQYISILMSPIALLFSTGLLFLFNKWDLTSLICIFILLADMSWIAFKNKNKHALYAQTLMLFILLQGISNYLIPSGSQVLTLFTCLTFVAFLFYRNISSIRTLLSDLLFSLTGLLCWFIVVLQMQNTSLALSSLSCIVIFTASTLILAFDKNKYISNAFCWVLSIVPLFIATSVYQLTSLSFPNDTSYSLSFFLCTFILTAVAILVNILKNEHIYASRLTLPFEISALATTGILYLQELMKEHRMPYLWVGVILLGFKAYYSARNSNKLGYHIYTYFALASMLVATMTSLEDYNVNDFNIIFISTLISLAIFAFYLISEKILHKDFRPFLKFSAFSIAIFSVYLLEVCSSDSVLYYFYIVASFIASYYAFNLTKKNVFGFLPLLILPYTINKIVLHYFYDYYLTRIFINFACFIIISVFARFIYKFIVIKDKNTLMIDWLTILNILFILNIPDNKYTGFIVFIFIALYIIQYFRKTADKNTNKIVIILSCASLTIAYWIQPFVYIPNIIRAEYHLIPIIIMCAIAIKLWKGQEKTTWLVSYIVACVSIFYLVISALDSEEVVDALILGCLMIIIIVISFIYKSKRWFLLSSCTLAFIIVYLTREFWLSLYWWVYLLAAGIILLSLAATNEIRKQKGIEKRESRLIKHFKK